MDMKQNENGIWCKAEPVKASWENNKILMFFRELFSKNKCFQEHKDKDGKCHGLYGGDRFTDYLNYDCIGCKHLELTIKKKEKGD